jgi:pimeloyl-ACP methyl ester carboxylesterase
VWLGRRVVTQFDSEQLPVHLFREQLADLLELAGLGAGEFFGFRMRAHRSSGLPAGPQPCDDRACRIPALADRYHLVAPDYPGFGHSSMPSRDHFTYTFDNLAKVVDEFTQKVGLKKYALYVQDYGAPVGFRLAVKHPEHVTAIVVQNGNAYDEGLDNDFWKPLKAYWKEPKSKEKRDALRKFLTYEATKWQYTHGVKDP